MFIIHKFNQNSWLKPHTDMTADLRKNAKMILKKDFFNLMTNVKKICKSYGKCEKT